MDATPLSSLQVSDDTLFEIQEDIATGNKQLWLRAGVTLDYETDQTREVTVSAIDGIETVTGLYTLTITNAAESAPVFDGDDTSTTDENNADFSHALPFSSDLPDGGVTLSLAQGVGDNDLFEITTDDDGNHYLVVKTLTDESAEDAAARVLDNEAAQTRTVTVTATDNSDATLTLTTDQVIIITISDIFDDAPIFGQSEFLLNPNETNVSLGNVNATSDISAATIDYSIDDVATARGFAIDSSTGELSFNGAAYDNAARGDEITIEVKTVSSHQNETVEGTHEIKVTIAEIATFIATDNADNFTGFNPADTVSYINAPEGDPFPGTNNDGFHGVVVDLSDNSNNAREYAAGDVLTNIRNIIGSNYIDVLTGDEYDNILAGGGGNDVFVAHSADGDTDMITDFTSGDKIRVDVVDPSSINNLASLFGTLSISQATSSSGVTLTFDRGASDYMIVLDGFSTSLTFTDFEVI